MIERKQENVSKRNVEKIVNDIIHNRYFVRNVNINEEDIIVRVVYNHPDCAGGFDDYDIRRLKDVGLRISSFDPELNGIFLIGEYNDLTYDFFEENDKSKVKAEKVTVY